MILAEAGKSVCENIFNVAIVGLGTIYFESKGNPSLVLNLV